MYNYLNLPVEIVFSDDHKINYLYDASGRKLRMTITYADRTFETFNYCGGVIYHDQDLESIEFGVGRVVKKPDSHFYYQYYMTDHLGNIRQVYEYNESTHEVEVVQENNYYPYGLTMGGLNIYSGIESTHLYQSKELENKTRLNWYDFHARRFDSQLGRWHAIDPVMQFASPYVGMGNNPVIGVDPDGTSSSCFWCHIKNFFQGNRYTIRQRGAGRQTGTGKGDYDTGFDWSCGFGDYSYYSGGSSGGYNNSTGYNSQNQNPSGSGGGGYGYGVVPSTPENPYSSGWGGGLGAFSDLAHGPSVGEQIMQLAQSNNVFEGVRLRIVDIAYNYIGVTIYNRFTVKGEFLPGVYKCNLFIYDVLVEAGVSPGLPNRPGLKEQEIGLKGNRPPVAAQWADPDYVIPGWSIVTFPLPGDIASYNGHCGVVVGNNQTISATPYDGVKLSDWGFREGQAPAFRRFNGYKNLNCSIWLPRN